jgi:hypothetical protein
MLTSSSDVHASKSSSDISSHRVVAKALLLTVRKNYDAVKGLAKKYAGDMIGLIMPFFHPFIYVWTADNLPIRARAACVRGPPIP